MSVNPSPIGGYAGQFFDNNGQPLSGGKIYTYAAGTTTPQATYTSAAGVTPHANPIVLDSAGRVPGGEIWLTDGLVYKFVIETSTSILIGSYDNITGVNSNFINYTVQEEVQTATAGQTVFTLTTINYTPGTNSLAVYIDGVNQYVGDSYLETDSTTVTFTSGLHVGAEVKFTTAVQTTTGAVDASIVSYEPPFTNSVATTVEDKLAQYVSVKDFGAVGDGVADDYAAFAAALTAASGKTLYVPSPSVAYKIGTGTLTVPANTAIVGQTPKATRLNHAFNGTMFILEDGASLINLYLHGDGATYSGKCMDFQGTNGRQTIQSVRATDWQDEVMYFAVAAGSQSTTYDCRFERRNAGTGTNKFAVVIDPAQQLSAVPRKFTLIETGGTCAFDFGGCNNVYVSDSFLADLKYTADSRAVLLSNCRIANMLALTVYGNYNVMTGCDISPQITIGLGADAWNFDGCVFNNLPVIDASGNNRNMVSHYPITYTPVLTSGGVAPSLGDGTLIGYASRNGTTVNVNIILTVGATTTLGTGQLRFSLPTWAPNSNGYTQVCGVTLMNDAGVFYTGLAQIPGGAQYVRLFRDTSGPVTSTSPVTFAAGDIITIDMEYEV